jgi:hypothetical protein
LSVPCGASRGFQNSLQSGSSLSATAPCTRAMRGLLPELTSGFVVTNALCAGTAETAALRGAILAPECTQSSRWKKDKRGLASCVKI